MRLIYFVCVCTGLLLFTPVQRLVHAEQRPDLIVILADDLGYSDLGCYGSEIETPRLDALAAAGLKFTQFYNTARCWPTRGSLMTGYYAQQIHRDGLLKNDGVRRGSAGERPAWAPLVAATLQDAGYHTFHSGKWHIDGQPLATGFERSYQVGDDNRYFAPQGHSEDGKPLPPVQPGSDFYMTTQIAGHAIKCIEEHCTSERQQEPFFSYVAFTAPHFPLHAKPEDIAKYAGSYDTGWDLIREARYQNQRTRLGIRSPLASFEPAIGPPYAFPEAIKKLGAGEVTRELAWSQLTSEQQTFQATKMQLHAAMVDRMDQEVGRIIDTLQKHGRLQNTLLLFLSDNGASAEIMIRGDGHDPQANPGSASSFLCLGPGWSRCSNTPFRRHKTWVHEGGIATPLIVHWPEKIKQSGTQHAVGHVIDIYPTLLDAAGIAATQPSENASNSTVDQAPPNRPGQSLLPLFLAPEKLESRTLWWLHEGNRAIRVGDWKLVAAKGEPWELYDLAVDRAESNNLADEMPDTVQQLSDLWDEQHARIEQQPKSRPNQSGRPRQQR